MTDETRVEKDSLGEKSIPQDKYYGIQTVRAAENFPVSGVPNHSGIIHAYAVVKKAAALTHMEVGWLDEVIGRAIVTAAEEVMTGDLSDHFIVDQFQAGAGTSTNMNVNEVIANRALEILGHDRGRYDIVSPNDHVNMGQSTNDTFPTVMHIAVYTAAMTLAETVTSLALAFMAKGEAFDRVIKPGRTHLQDAMPVTLGMEFTAYGEALERNARTLARRASGLLPLPLGGTATGTGINTHPEYRDLAVSHIAEITGQPYTANPQMREAMQSMTRVVAVSSACRELAVDLTRIANDLRLMASGPTAGLADIVLPAVQPGSSIMPGKVNPVMAECLNMVCFTVMGNDATVVQAAAAGQLELNVMMPVMANVMLRSCDYLINYLPVFEAKCVRGITADADRLKEKVMQNPALATLLNRKIGYLAAAEVAKASVNTGRPVIELVVERGLMSRAEADDVFSLGAMVNRPDEDKE